MGCVITTENCRKGVCNIFCYTPLMSSRVYQTRVEIFFWFIPYRAKKRIFSLSIRCKNICFGQIITIITDIKSNIVYVYFTKEKNDLNCFIILLNDIWKLHLFQLKKTSTCFKVYLHFYPDTKHAICQLTCGATIVILNTYNALPIWHNSCILHKCNANPISNNSWILFSLQQGTITSCFKKESLDYISHLR